MSSNMIFIPPAFPVGLADPYWDKVVLLMHMEGVNGSTVFKDEKNHAIGGTINTRLSTERFKFGSSSYKNTENNYIAGDHADFAFGKGDFTIECWVNNTQRGHSSSYGISGIIGMGQAGGIAGVGLAINSAGTVTAAAYGANMVTGQEAVALNEWTHLALARVGNTARLFVNGKLSGTAQNEWDLTATRLSIGTGYMAYVSNGFNGFIDELRITKGVGRYVEPFTPPTAPFPSA